MVVVCGVVVGVGVIVVWCCGVVCGYGYGYGVVMVWLFCGCGCGCVVFVV